MRGPLSWLNVALRRLGKRAVVLTLLGTAILAAGCAGGVAPPAADVAGIQVVALFPFGNDTEQAGLEEVLLEHLAADLQAVGWYEVLSAEKVAEAMAQRRPPSFWDADDEQWLEMARDVTLELGGDGFVVGRIVSYEEEISVGEPYAEVGENADGAEAETAEWRVVQTTRVAVTLAAQFVNAHTGDVVHERTVVGVGRVDDVRLLNWALPTPPPEALLPSPHRRDIQQARELAVEQALRGFAADLLPQLQESPPAGEASAGDTRGAEGG